MRRYLYSTVFVGVIAMSSVGLTLSQQRAFWNSINARLLGFPYDVISEDMLLCYVGMEKYIIRSAAYRIDRQYFTRDNLRTLFTQGLSGNNPVQELHVSVFSDSDEAEWLFEPRIGGPHLAWIPDPKPGLERFMSLNNGFAEYYRLRGNEAFWYELPGGRKEEPVVLKGENPYEAKEVSFPFSIVTNVLQKDHSRIECGGRTMYILIRACDLSQDQLKHLFRWIAKQFPLPIDLEVSVVANSETGLKFIKEGAFWDWIYSLRLRTLIETSPCSESSNIPSISQLVTYSRNARESVFRYYTKYGRSSPVTIEVPLR